MAFTLKINGTPHEVDVDGDTPLLWVLRDVLGMTGTTFGCGQALCGACTVHVDGAATRSCITTVDSIGESAITTIEAIGQAPQGAALQKAWLELEVVQCGYSQSGQIMSEHSTRGHFSIHVAAILIWREGGSLNMVAAFFGCSCFPGVFWGRHYHKALFREPR